MEQFTLPVAVRTETGKATKRVREEGKVPGIVYGRDVEPQIVSVEDLVLTRIFHKAGHTGLIELAIGDKKPVHVLITDVQTNHLGRIQHVDFHQVKMDEIVRTEVPLRLVGDAPAVFNLGGSLVQTLEEVEVEALPAFLPSHIEVDVSGLEELEVGLSVADIVMPDKVTLLTDVQETVCKIEPPRSEEEMAALDAEMGDEVPAEVAEGEEAADEGSEAGETKE